MTDKYASAAAKTSVGEKSVCSCGRHFGIGCWSVDEHAAIAGRMRDRLASYMSTEMQLFLESYEAVHGQVKWDEGNEVTVAASDGHGTVTYKKTILTSHDMNKPIQEREGRYGY